MDKNEVMYVLESCYGRYTSRLNKLKDAFEQKYELLDESCQLSIIQKFQKFASVKTDVSHSIEQIRASLDHSCSVSQKHELQHKCMTILWIINFYEEDIGDYYHFLINGSFPKKKVISH
jgi:hypothetical protein